METKETRAKRFKKSDRVKVQVVGRTRILSEFTGIVNQDDNGLFIMNQGFLLYLYKISETNNIIKS